MQASRGVRCVVLLSVLLTVRTAGADERTALTEIRLVAPDPSQAADGILRGRILVTAADGGIVFEDRSGRIDRLRPEEFTDLHRLHVPLQWMNDEELASLLLKQFGSAADILVTKHYVICSEASEMYTEFCGTLLEQVNTEFESFFRDSGMLPQDHSRMLPVVLFRDNARLQEFAGKQHPETDFTNVPGYYSIRENQMLIAAAAGERQMKTRSDLLRELRRNPRQVETVVHEAVHQLCFNRGLMVRYADNPLWLSEGLAVWFETITGRSSTVWSRPGSVSGLYLPVLQRQSGTPTVSLQQLISSDEAFRTADQAGDAYAASWALTHYLLNSHREAWFRMVAELQNQVPLTPVPPETRLARFREAFGKSPADLEADLTNHIRRLRAPR